MKISFAIRHFCGLGALLLLTLFCGLGFQHFRQESALAPMLLGSGHKRDSPPPQEKKQRQERRQLLSRLWMARHERDIVPALVQSLNDPFEPWRQSAARGLGRLEDTRGEAVLVQRLQTVESAMAKRDGDAYGRAKGISPLTLKLALGRIRARSLRGQAKLDALAKSIGLSWPDVVRLSQKVNAPKSYGQYTPAAHILREFLDVLYQEGKRGQDIGAWSKQLTLPPAHKILLRGASLSNTQEVKLILDYLSRLSVAKQDSYDLLSHFISYKNGESKAVLTFLKEMPIDPENTINGKDEFSRYRVNCDMMFTLAASLSPAQSQPVLRRFQASHNIYMRSYAKSSISFAEKKELSVELL